MKIDKSAPAFQPVTVTFETAAEAAAVRKMLGRTNEIQHADDAEVERGSHEAERLNDAMYSLYKALEPT